MQTIIDLQHKIRDIVNIPRRHRAFRKRRASFRQACSALDAIDDTALAITEYLVYEEPSETGIKYIFTYGVLQAIFLQQDAIRHLALSLGLPFELPEELKKIRKLRNESIGHPTQRDINKKKGIHSFHFLSRHTLSKKGFQLLSTYSNRESFDEKDVNLIEVIKTQSKFAQQLLEKIFQGLQNEENAHREMYMNEKLSDIFKEAQYPLGKVAECIRDKSYYEFALTNLTSILETIDLFHERLLERDEDGIDGIKKELNYPVKKIISYLKKEGKENQRQTEINLEYVSAKVDTMKEMAYEIDQEYEKRV